MEENQVIEQQQGMGLFSRIINVFIAPGATFKAVKVKPAWLIPAIIYAVLAVGMTHLIKPVVMDVQKEKTVEALMERGMAEDQAEEIAEKNLGIGKILMYPMALIGSFVAFFVLAGIWLFVSNIILGGQAKYSQLLGVVVYKSFIDLLGGYIKVPVILSKESIDVHFSVAMFLQSSESFLYKFLSKVEVFNIWGIAVLCIGIAIMSNREVKKVVPWVIGVYVLYYVVSISIGSLVGA
ncbi:hypothetical protein GF407_01285 [candidate division KSB1 bacterium]|nr:hypothetical protein [candidate division KSB1 bacterium]